MNLPAVIKLADILIACTRVYATLVTAAWVNITTQSPMLPESTQTITLDTPTTNYSSVNTKLYLIAGMTIGAVLIIVFVGGYYLRVRLQRTQPATGSSDQEPESEREWRPPTRHKKLTKEQFGKLCIRRATGAPGGSEPEACVVCLAEIETGDRLVFLPCAHGYHYECIESWLCHKSAFCPLCKMSAIAEA